MGLSNFEIQKLIKADKSLSIQEKAFLYNLTNYNNPDIGFCYPSQLHIAEDLSISRRYVTELVKSLKEKKKLKVTKRREPNERKRTVTNYTILLEKKV